ncbi:hypothetical protein CEXT_171451 [Caerostris extrusa]|uniref:Uncharacterized protein n=1 Tax=Caerostris extrusa TaxID=172846 RepID=A0AAV4QXG4_CAEEX|nr:hypothetical protein CEXT_171451 [Caerostris extrusa]
MIYLMEFSDEPRSTPAPHPTPWSSLPCLLPVLPAEKKGTISRVFALGQQSTSRIGSNPNNVPFEVTKSLLRNVCL